MPVEDWPTGRKGKATAEAWLRLRSEVRAGLLVIDNDVAADPDDLAAMRQAVEQLPQDVHTGLVKGWPASTGRPDWIWSHRGGTLGSPVPGQDETVPIAYISTCFVWLPARLLDLAAPELPYLRWEQVDVFLSEVALAHDIPCHAVYQCRPKHLHF